MLILDYQTCDELFWFSNNIMLGGKAGGRDIDIKIFKLLRQARNENEIQQGQFN